MLLQTSWHEKNEPGNASIMTLGSPVSAKFINDSVRASAVSGLRTDTRSRTPATAGLNTVRHSDCAGSGGNTVAVFLSVRERTLNT
jgi:hypothetical protein